MSKINVNDLINVEKNFMVKKTKEKLLSIDDYDEFKHEISNALNVFEYKYNSSYKQVIREIWNNNSANLDSDLIEEIYNREVNIVDYNIVNIMSRYIEEGDCYLEAWEKTRKKLVNGEYSISKIAESYK